MEISVNLSPNAFLRYSQSLGTMDLVDGETSLRVGTGWAGNHAGKNNPDMQSVPSTGPLPQGRYTLQPWEAYHGHLGPLVSFLKPDPANEMFGRGDFFIHGPALSPASYGQESKGCIVLAHDVRQKLADLGVTALEVIP